MNIVVGDFLNDFRFGAFIANADVCVDMRFRCLMRGW